MDLDDKEIALLQKLGAHGTSGKEYGSMLMEIDEADVSTAYRLVDHELAFAVLDKAGYVLYASITFQGRKVLSRLGN